MRQTLNQYRELLRLSKGNEQDRKTALGYLETKIKECGQLSPMERMLYIELTKRGI
jgi:hypothetical protein